ncbi:unnamed protein product [Staurois parvus]|uniref:Uncharacterized protein n=1 Tax=Staurois parvus TaxID=386267 RepID=A0ABN9BAY9_9NEOB|nr:unnamed protein product [Staurois parvus]
MTHLDLQQHEEAVQGPMDRLRAWPSSMRMSVRGGPWQITGLSSSNGRRTGTHDTLLDLAAAWGGGTVGHDRLGPGLAA